MTKKSKAVPALDEPTRRLLRRLLRENVRPYSWRLAAATLCMGLVAAATAMNAWLMEPVLDQVFVEKNLEMLYVIPGVVVAVAVIKGFSSYGQSVLMTGVGQRIIADLQVAMFSHLMRADLAFFHKTSTGQLISRFTNDVAMLRAAVSTALTGIAKDFLTLIALVAVMFYQNWSLAIIAFFVFPVAVLPIARIGRRIRRVSVDTQTEMAEFTSLLDDTFLGARHVRAYGMEAYETGRAANLVKRIYKLMMKSTRVRSIAHPMMEALGGIAVAVIVLYGGSQVIAGTTTPGTFFSFVSALLMAYQPMKDLAKLNANLEEGLAAAQRVYALLDLEAEIRDAPGARPLVLKGGAVRLDNVQFAYAPDKPALKGLSLSIPAGAQAALVGASGSGKSTILNLIPRFYDVQSGSVTVDGQDVRGLTLASLRGAIALVSQEVSLFDDTVRANIAYGKPDATAAEIEAAARTAAAHDFIAALPQGYDTPVGGQGVMLSGGQRQRIAIARAMLKNAPILLLDEATSALDSDSERQVQAALSTLMKGRTTLVVAHRLSTIKDADVIYVIGDGRVLESGTHAELLARRGAYARLHDMQFAEDTPAAADAPRHAPATDGGPDRPIRITTA